MDRSLQDRHDLIKQIDELLKERPASVEPSPTLLSALSAFLDLLRENQDLKRVYSQLYNIIQSLVELDKTAELKPILVEIANAAIVLLQSDTITIIPTTPDGDSFILQHATIVGQGQKYFKPPRKPRPNGVTAYLISSPSGLIHIKDTSDLASYPFLDVNSNSFLIKTGVKTFLGLRLGGKTQTLGFFFIDRVSPTAFTEEEIQFAELLGSLISIAMQIFVNIETRVLPVRADAMQNVQQAIISLTNSEQETDLSEFLTKLLDTALRITGIKDDGFGFVGLVDKIKNLLRVYVQVGQHKGEGTQSFRIGGEDSEPEGITGWVAKSGRPERVDDVRKDNRYLDLFKRGTISELIVPLRVKASVIGVVNLESPKPGAFHESDLHMLEGLANLASIAIHIIRKRQAQHDDSTFANVIISSLDTNETLNRFYDYVEARTQAHDMAILSYDVDENVFRLDEFPFRATEHAKDLLVVPYGEGLSGNAAKMDKVIYVPDVQILVEGNREYIQWIAGTRANMAIPLKIGQRLIGILNIESPIPHAFDEVDEDQLRIMASFAAIALENAKRYQSTVHFQASSVFVGLFVSKFHDLFGNTIKPAAVKLEGIELKLIELEKKGKLPALLHSLSDEIEAIRQKIDQGIHDAQDLAISASEVKQFSSRFEDAPNKSIDECLNLALSQLNIPSSIQVIRNYRDDVASALVKGPLLEIFRNLFKNSVDAIKKVGGEGTITVSALDRHGWMRIVVKDTGCGIPDKDINKVFDIGYTAGGRGLGLGLHIVQGMIELFGGKIKIKDNKPGKTTFTFNLPLAK